MLGEIFWVRRVRRVAAVVLVGLTAFALPAVAQVVQSKNTLVDKFRQLDETWPTPGDTRTGSGAPGERYWQQQADYVMEIKIDEPANRLSGKAAITYTNNSPDALDYLWVQLHQNWLKEDSLANTHQLADEEIFIATDPRAALVARQNYNAGMDVISVRSSGKALPFVVNDTMMRVDLPAALAPGGTLTFSIEWAYTIHDHADFGGRSGREFFEADGNNIYLLAQFFPRMAAYTDYGGWRNKQFLGNGEFTLEFGNYDVSITVPADHIVASTGVLQNPVDVLSGAQRQRLARARNASEPVQIVTLEEAVQNEEAKSRASKTWRFRAENVRDFAFATSRKFLWDAMGMVPPGGEDTVMIMSYYPSEAEPLWAEYATKANAQAVKTYSEYLFPYPYPVSIAVNGPVGGMEYPMINFDAPRPSMRDAEGSLASSRGDIRRLASVIIHEVGHNYFPMIVNSDERQWAWQDEGLNSFVEYIAALEWDANFPRGPFQPRSLAGYMTSRNQVPIMTHSDSLLSYGYNAYAKTAVALMVLRETVMGPELFDHAFKTYAKRWKFKRATPSDFFRTMEDASAVDLDWFWRGWFYSTDHVDVSVDSLRLLRQIGADADLASVMDGVQETALSPEPFMSEEEIFRLNKSINRDPSANQGTALNAANNAQAAQAGSAYFYRIEFTNRGGLPSALILDADLEDGTKKRFRFPPEIWNLSSQRANKILITQSPITRVVLDPERLTADSNVGNNVYPRSGVQNSGIDQTSGMTDENAFPALNPKMRPSSRGAHYHWWLHESGQE